MANVRNIEGIAPTIKLIENSPSAAFKMIKKSFREAGKVGKKAIISKTPKILRRLVKFAIYENTKENMVLRVGYFPDNKLTVGDSNISLWKVAYWQNYGTLKRRDPSHKFNRPITNKKKRNNIGQHHQNFFENAIIGVDNLVLTSFQNSMKKYEDELIKK